MNKLLLGIYLIILFVGCRDKQNASVIKDGKYKGYATVFFHRPVSGSNYEIFIIPTPMDSLSLLQTLKSDISNIKYDIGVSCSDNYYNKNFSAVIDGSIKIKLLNNSTLASHLQAIHFCPVFVDFSNADNKTNKITGTSKDILKEKFVFENNHMLTIRYYLTSDVKINVIRPLF